MKKQFTLVFTILSAFFAATSLSLADDSGLSKTSAAAKVDAQAKPGYVADELLVQFYVGVSDDKMAEVVKGHGAAEVEEIKAIRVKRIKVPPQALDQVKNALSHNPHVKFVENNYIAGTDAVPNDPSYISQWHLPKISAPQGWDICTGSSLVGIAVIDSGVDPTHPDLATKLIPGWSFLTGTSDAHDVYGHGTAVAGAAGALSNNGAGVAGVAWQNPIMPLVVVDGTNGASYSDVASAITYAIDHGMRVLNLSLGGSSSSWTMQNAVSYAWNNGGVVIASAGNDNTSTPSYPAACTYAIAVGSTNSSDNRSSFSNYGSWLTVTAPGSYIFTTNNGGGYGAWNGTSFSAPITSGLAALILSVNPALTNQQLKEILINNTDDLGTAGFDQYFGYGRINVAKSLQAAKTTVIPPDTTPPVVTVSSPADGATVSGKVTVSMNATDDVGVAKVEFMVDGSVVAADSAIPYSFLWDTTNLPSGTYRLQARAVDAAGNFAYSTAVTVTVPPVKPAGDMNGDGVVDINDALMALRISVGEASASAEQTKLGDVAPLVNGQPAPDGVIDLQDALLILKVGLGIIKL